MKLAPFRILTISGLLAVATLALAAQTVEATPDGTRISATAEASISVKPDQAQMSIAVVTEAPTSQEAGSRNATETEKLLSALKSALGNSGEYKTSGYWINPRYSGGPREANRITGYLARNSVEATIADLTIVSKVIDAAMRAGANNMGGLRFTVKDEEAAKTKALVQATSSAREKAGAMAKALGLRVVRVLAVTDTDTPTPGPLMMEARTAMAQSAPSTPVEPGMIEARSRVTVSVLAK